MKKDWHTSVVLNLLQLSSIVAAKELKKVTLIMESRILRQWRSPECIQGRGQQELKGIHDPCGGKASIGVYRDRIFTGLRWPKKLLAYKWIA